LRCSTAWTWFLRPVRSRTSWPRRLMRRRARRVGSSASQTCRRSPSRGAVRGCGRRAGRSWLWPPPTPLVIAALATTTRATCGSTQPGDGQRVAGRLQPDLVGRPERTGDGLKRCSAGGDPRMPSHRPASEDRHFADVAVDVGTNRTHAISSSRGEGDRRANDNYGYVLAAQPGQSQGRPTTTTGSQPIVTILGLPYLRSPGNPGPGGHERSEPSTAAPGAMSWPDNERRPHRGLDLGVPLASNRTTARFESAAVTCSMVSFTNTPRQAAGRPRTSPARDGAGEPHASWVIRERSLLERRTAMVQCQPLRHGRVK
jgi:hypothetical protein